MTSSSMYVVRNSLEISTIATYQFPYVSMVMVINNNSVDTFGDLESDFLGVFCWFWPSTHFQPFNFPHRFYLGKTFPVAHIHAAVE